MHTSEGRREGCTVGRYRKRLRVDKGDPPTEGYGARKLHDQEGEEKEREKGESRRLGRRILHDRHLVRAATATSPSFAAPTASTSATSATKALATLDIVATAGPLSARRPLATGGGGVTGRGLVADTRTVGPVRASPFWPPTTTTTAGRAPRVHAASRTATAFERRPAAASAPL